MVLGTKLPKIIRLDDTDTRVYERAAAAGEWAVPGTFKFWDSAPESLSGKSKQAFAHGFLGTASFGWSTLVVISEIDDEQYDGVVQQLARYLVTQYGAPDIATALPAAREEAEFASGLCEHDIGSLLAVQREFAAEEIRENFKLIRATSAANHNNLSLWGLENT